MRLTTIFRRRLLLAGVATVAGIMGTGYAGAQPKAPPTSTKPAEPREAETDPKTRARVVPLGGSAKISPNRGVIKDARFDTREDIAGKEFSEDGKSLIIAGRTGGATVITLTFLDDSKITYTVVVQPDYEQLKFVIRRAVPTASVEIIPGVGDVIILSGTVSRPEDADTAVRIASSAVGGNTNNVINAIQVGGSQHVMIDVTVAQVDRTELRERGFSFGIGGTQVGGGSVLAGLAASGASLGTIPTFTTGSNANILAGIVPAQFTGALRALKTEGVAKFLSEPKIVTQTGRPAFIRAGGQQAVLSPSAGINGPGVQLLPVGTEMEVLPIVHGNGKIYLEVNPRISSVNNGRGITTAFGFTPGFNEQQTRSSIMLESGQTFAIGGLLETTVQANAQKVPYLGELPLIGAAFSSVSHDERETELLILVTPRLVEPMDSQQVGRRLPGKESRSPDDYELFVESLLEAPRGCRKPWVNGQYVPAHRSGNAAAPVAPLRAAVATEPAPAPVVVPYITGGDR
jgi:pilus assembly protein CpaC